jgi:hypothetical protein
VEYALVEGRERYLTRWRFMEHRSVIVSAGVVTPAKCQIATLQFCPESKRSLAKHSNLIKLKKLLLRFLVMVTYLFSLAKSGITHHLVPRDYADLLDTPHGYALSIDFFSFSKWVFPASALK